MKIFTIVNHQSKIVNFFMVVFLLFPFSALAGNLDSPAAPTDSGSAMYTLSDIYNRLNDGTAATKRAGAFTEPSAGPASTGKTLDDVMALVDSRAPVEKTGQTTSFAAGDDGDLEKGVTWPNPRFTDNGDGTVTDNLTGLMWKKDANAGNDCDGADIGTETWTNALASAAQCNTDSFAGFTDWRLPNIKELLSLIHWGFNQPALSNAAGTAKWSANDPFANVQSFGDYWSSTTDAGTSGDALMVFMSNGSVTSPSKLGLKNVWPVRGGQ